MVMGDDSCLRSRGFESQCCILDGLDFFTFICCKHCIVCLKRPTINGKDAGLAHFFFFKKNSIISCLVKSNSVKPETSRTGILPHMVSAL